MTGLGHLITGPPTLNWISAASGDGSVLVGTSGDPVHGFRIQSGVASSLADNTTGAFVEHANGVSPDGRIVVGDGASPQGRQAYRWENGVITPCAFLPGGQ